MANYPNPWAADSPVWPLKVNLRVKAQAHWPSTETSCFVWICPFSPRRRTTSRRDNSLKYAKPVAGINRQSCLFGNTSRFLLSAWFPAWNAFLGWILSPPAPPRTPAIGSPPYSRLFAWLGPVESHLDGCYVRTKRELHESSPECFSLNQGQMSKKIQYTGWFSQRVDWENCELCLQNRPLQSPPSCCTSLGHRKLGWKTSRRHSWHLFWRAHLNPNLQSLLKVPWLAGLSTSAYSSLYIYAQGREASFSASPIMGAPNEGDGQLIQDRQK